MGPEEDVDDAALEGGADSTETELRSAVLDIIAGTVGTVVVVVLAVVVLDVVVVVVVDSVCCGCASVLTG